jgi:phytoene synthase
MLDPGLRRECEEAIRAGSKSFLAASMLLPGSTRIGGPGALCLLPRRR